MGATASALEEEFMHVVLSDDVSDKEVLEHWLWTSHYETALRSNKNE